MDDYAALKAALASSSHRSDLTTEIPGFIRLAEGKIRNELVGYELTATLSESDRDADGVYDLPATLRKGVIRSVEDADEAPLTNVGTAEIKSIDANADPIYYTVRGNQIEFRGVPATDAEFSIKYFGHPAPFADDADTNDLLTYDEAVYLYGALHFLFKHTQDLELAQDALNTFDDAITKLNDQHSRKVSGARTFSANYNLRNLPKSGGY